MTLSKTNVLTDEAKSMLNVTAQSKSEALSTIAIPHDSRVQRMKTNI